MINLTDQSAFSIEIPFSSLYTKSERFIPILIFSLLDVLIAVVDRETLNNSSNKNLKKKEYLF